MRFNQATRTLSLACLSMAALSGADSNSAFRVKPAEEYPNAQRVAGLVLAADAYSTGEQTKGPFGKLNPNEYHVLPVLLVLSNQSGVALRLSKMRVSYVSGRQTVEATPASEVPFLNAPDRPKVSVHPIPRIGKAKKNPLAAPEIESRSFAAKMLAPGESAHGFFYFHLTHRPGSTLYVTGIEEAATGKELFFVEIALGK